MAKKDPRSENPGSGNNMKDTLQFAPGARVMLTRNFDVSDGLVSGSLGTATGQRKTWKEGMFIYML